MFDYNKYTRMESMKNEKSRRLDAQRRMPLRQKRATLVSKIFYNLFLVLIIAQGKLFSQSSLEGIWENASRFIEFSATTMNIVLKPYYGFVWEDSGEIPIAYTAENSIIQVSISYPGEKTTYTIPLALINDKIYTSFLQRYPIENFDSLVTQDSFDGYWLSAGNSSRILRYKQESLDELFAYYFKGNAYCRIKYWKTDALQKDVQARLELKDGSSVFIPKFLKINETLYTCITSTGKVVRNYEKGSFVRERDELFFKPDSIVYIGADSKKAIPFTLSQDGAILALGESYLIRSAITNLDAEIKAHNGLRRPLRKPVFDYMELDFRWDEIEKIRGKDNPSIFKPLDH